MQSENQILDKAECWTLQGQGDSKILVKLCNKKVIRRNEQWRVVLNLIMVITI